MMLKAQAIPTWKIKPVNNVKRKTMRRIPTWPTPTIVTLLPEWATGAWIEVISFCSLVAILVFVCNLRNNKNDSRSTQHRQTSAKDVHTIKTNVTCNNCLPVTILIFSYPSGWQRCNKGIPKKHPTCTWTRRARSRVTFMNVKLKSPRTRLPSSWLIRLPFTTGLRPWIFNKPKSLNWDFFFSKKFSSLVNLSSKIQNKHAVLAD